jgi:hypothetical protein
MMWHSIGPNLYDSSGKPLATLLHSQNGILPHIRDLYVGNTAIDTGAEDRIRLLLSALPRDRLTVFTAAKRISPLTVQMLLQSQRELQQLQVRVLDDPSYLDDGHACPFQRQPGLDESSSKTSLKTYHICLYVRESDGRLFPLLSILAGEHTWSGGFERHWVS